MLKDKDMAQNYMKGIGIGKTGLHRALPCSVFLLKIRLKGWEVRHRAMTVVAALHNLCPSKVPLGG